MHDSIPATSDQVSGDGEDATESVSLNTETSSAAGDDLANTHVQCHLTRDQLLPINAWVNSPSDRIAQCDWGVRRSQIHQHGYQVDFLFASVPSDFRFIVQKSSVDSGFVSRFTSMRHG